MSSKLLPAKQTTVQPVLSCAEPLLPHWLGYGQHVQQQLPASCSTVCMQLCLALLRACSL